MAKSTLTDEQVEFEIARLNKNPHVRLCKEYTRIAYKRRHYLYLLRWMEKKGIELERAGVSLDSLREEEEYDE